MSFNDRITEDLKNAIKGRNPVRTSCLRMLKASLKNKQIEKGRELTDEETQAIISSLIRKNKEAIKEFRNGGREDLATKEGMTFREAEPPPE